MIARASGKEPWLLQQLLDMGVNGVIMPVVRTLDEAKTAVRSSYYPPKGVRGIGPVIAARQWGVSVEEYLQIANAQIVSILLIEHIDAAISIDSILTIPDIDLIMIGAHDLASSMGLVGQPNHPDVVDVVNRIEVSVKAAGIPLGSTAGSVEEANGKIQAGYRAILFGGEAAFISEGARSTLEQIRH